MHIKPTHTLTREELREIAFAAADNSQPVHEACPAGLSVEQRNEFQGAYVERRLSYAQAGKGVVCAEPAGDFEIHVLHGSDF